MQPKNFDSLDGMRQWLRGGADLGKEEKIERPERADLEDYSFYSYVVYAKDFGPNRLKIAKFLRDRFELSIPQASNRTREPGKVAGDLTHAEAVELVSELTKREAVVFFWVEQDDELPPYSYPMSNEDPDPIFVNWIEKIKVNYDSDYQFNEALVARLEQLKNAEAAWKMMRACEAYFVGGARAQWCYNRYLQLKAGIDLPFGNLKSSNPI